MFDLIYVENAVRDHPRVRAILPRYPRAAVVPCERYGEVFNRRAQNFRLQKRRPALILAAKFDHFVLEAPAGYGIGHERSFYFSHMLNCVYDCRYCFLQGLYSSAHLVLFVNYEDFQTAIDASIDAAAGRSACFFSGYDCDSLALEPLSGFVEYLLPLIARHPGVCFELRTKSAHIRPLLHAETLSNCVVAYSLSPRPVAEELEAGAPSLESRLGAMETLAERGWPLGLRFDPVIFRPDFEDLYSRFFTEVFDRIPAERIHSVSLGSFRLPRENYKRVSRLYPEVRLFAEELEERDGMVSYRAGRCEELLEFCAREILRRVPPEVFFPCHAPAGSI